MRKGIVYGLLIALGLPVLAALAVRAYWTKPWRRYEVLRITSPDSVVDAVLLGVGGTPRAPNYYALHLVPARQPVAWRDKPVLTVRRQSEDFSVRWRRPKLVDVRYTEALIADFRSFWRSRDVQNYFYLVEVRLTPLADSSSIPRGYDVQDDIPRGTR